MRIVVLLISLFCFTTYKAAAHFDFAVEDLKNIALSSENSQIVVKALTNLCHHFLEQDNFEEYQAILVHIAESAETTEKRELAVFLLTEAIPQEQVVVKGLERNLFDHYLRILMRAKIDDKVKYNSVALLVNRIASSNVDHMRKLVQILPLPGLMIVINQYQGKEFAKIGLIELAKRVKLNPKRHQKLIKKVMALNHSFPPEFLLIVALAYKQANNTEVMKFVSDIFEQKAKGRNAKEYKAYAEIMKEITQPKEAFSLVQWAAVA